MLLYSSPWSCRRSSGMTLDLIHACSTRIVSKVWLVGGALWLPLEMLGYYQPRDAHVHG